MSHLEPIGLSASLSASIPAKREKMTIQAYGKFFEVDKEEYKKEMLKQAGLYISPLNSK